MPSVSIVGVGRLGGALAIALSRSGYTISDLICRRRETAERVLPLVDGRPGIVSIDDLKTISSDILLITTSDPDIEPVAERLARIKTEAKIVFHTSGSLSSDILKPLRSNDWSTGSLHPLLSVSEAVSGANAFGGAFFCLEGDTKALQAGEQIIDRLGGKKIEIETSYKSLYHASAVMVSGHLVALVEAGIEMLSKCGLNLDEAKQALLPLIRSSVENIASMPLERALTGPYARLDIDAFERHLEAFDRAEISDKILALYLELADGSLDLASKNAGASNETITELRERITMAKRNHGC